MLTNDLSFKNTVSLYERVKKYMPYLNINYSREYNLFSFGIVDLIKKHTFNL